MKRDKKLAEYRRRHPLPPRCATCGHGEERHTRRECLTWGVPGRPETVTRRCACSRYVPDGEVRPGTRFAAPWNDPRKEKVRNRGRAMRRNHA